MRSRGKKPTNTLITWRFSLVCSVVFLVFMSLVARAAFLQVIEPDKARSESDKRTVRVEKLHVQRGMIFDRNGKELAVSVPVVSVYADPKALHKSLVAKVLRQARKNGEDYKALAENQAELTKRTALYYQHDLRWRELADVLRIEPKKIDSRLRGDETRRFVYLNCTATHQALARLDKFPKPLRQPF